MSTVSIEITVAGQRYPLRVSAADEKVLRRAEAEIADRLKELQRTPGARNAQDHLAMVLLTAWVEKLKESNRGESNLKQVETRLAQTARLVESILDKP